MAEVRGVTTYSLNAVKRACDRSSKIANRKMKRGVNSLAVIASTAPFVGILGMLSGTPQVLNGIVHPCGECAGGAAELFVLPAMSLLVASAAMMFHGLLSAWGERFRVEMKAGSLQLMNDLVRPSTNI
jgi:biopolymer transport protein ExbB/TolQ